MRVKRAYCDSSHDQDARRQDPGTHLRERKRGAHREGDQNQIYTIHTAAASQEMINVDHILT